MAISLLLADDSPTIAKILTMALTNTEYSVRSVMTADKAVSELRQNPPAFFLVDISLPQMDGYALSKLVKTDPKLKHAHVILLATAFEPAEPIQVKDCMADAVMVKPFDPSELRATLQKFQTAPTAEPRTENTISSLLGNPLEPEKSETEVDVNTLLSSLQETEEGPPAFSAEPSGHTDLIQIDFPHKAATPPTDAPPSKLPDANADLSPNAKALSAFFEAEIASYKKPEGEEPEAIDLTGEISVSELDQAKLAEWSSSPPSGNENTLFDTGGSSFKFSSDYVDRITRAFSGDLEEHVPEFHETDPKPEDTKPVFTHQSSDAVKKAHTPTATATVAPKAAAPKPTAAPAFETRASVDKSVDKMVGKVTEAVESQIPTPKAMAASFGGWSAEETAKIEQMIREEVHLVCREIVEKVAWEIIPELAENLIKQELSKVMKELEN